MGTDRHRVFFALWPDDGVRDRIEAVSQVWRTASRCRWILPAKLHLTLAFLADVGAEGLPRLEAVGSSQRLQAPLELCLDQLELWRQPQVLCLTGMAPEPLRELVAELNRCLAAARFAVERRPFRCHLTLARDARRLPEDRAFEPIRWRTARLHLVESLPDLTGAPYRRLQSWDLLGPAASVGECG